MSSISYQVVFDELVFKKDFKHINRKDQQQIIKIIRKKLTTHPELYGKPLSRELQGYWKLKSGNFRIVYRILRQEVKVYVIAVGFRRNEEVYLEAAKRLGL